MSSTIFHVALNVRNVRQAAAFLELLLGTPPGQLHADYAKFELDDPGLVLSLVPSDAPGGAGLNHLGFRLPNHQALAALQTRLTAAGIDYDCEESVACCHSRQTKAWVHDPAGNLWELYVLEDAAAEPAVVALGGASADNTVARASNGRGPSPASPPSSWAHRLGQPLPDAIPAADGTLDELVLEGTFNARLTPTQQQGLLAEALRALRPGGRLLIHGVTADRSLIHPPALPGPARAVEQVPTTEELLSAVEAAGFVALELVTFGETYRFEHAGAELRETRLQAWRPATSRRGITVIYRGPFAQLVDDAGQVFPRGQRVIIDEADWQRLQASGTADQFVLIANTAQESPVR